MSRSQMTVLKPPERFKSSNSLERPHNNQPISDSQAIVALDLRNSICSVLKFFRSASDEPEVDVECDMEDINETRSNFHSDFQPHNSHFRCGLDGEEAYGSLG
jgi:hypothetical protein